MKFTLKDYQADAVRDVLENLVDARDMYHRRRRTSSFALSATTGAGKTVMAAAVIEALFDGNDEYDIEPDPGAVILWFTDDPSLNEQTRFRLVEASDLSHSRLKVIQPNFHAEKLEPGHVYFLNAQKLSKNSLLVRGAADDGDGFPGMAPPDLRAATMWDILRNTIEDERLTLYLVLDEAHKGMKAPSTRDRNEKQTIVKRLINGEAGSPAIPIVWGISATVKRFEEAMADAAGRTSLPSVAVDPIRVQESGLLKDHIRLEFPTEAGQFDTTLLARAVKRTREASAQWEEYARSQDPPIDPVIPLLVVQMPNKPDDALMLDAFRTVRENWPELSAEALAHVFGEHTTIELGGFEVPHVAPEKVQDQNWIRVLFAKDAISTGWDCPRAEVLMSFRPAQDETHITQLLGRMVRTPLARRVPGNDRLNSVECLLPRFNQQTALGVAHKMLGNGDESAPTETGRRVLNGPVELRPNPDIPDAVWAAFDAMPSQTLPRKAAKPVKRLLALAHALSQDGFRERARRDAYATLCSVLDGLAVQFAERLNAEMKDVGEMAGEAMVVNRDGGVATEVYTEVADMRAIDADFQAAGRALTRELALKYAEHLVGDADDDAFLDAHVRVASLARISDVLARLDVEAAALADAWFAEQRVAIKGLSHERQQAYDEIRAMAIEPYRIDVMRPDIRLEASLDMSGEKVPVATLHLMADESGEAPIGELNEWERKVLSRESDRPDFLGWYRNPARASSDSLAIAYQDGDHVWRRLCPDFVFFHGSPEAVQTSIVDPHGAHLGDALPKLRGLAAYAEEFGEAFHRIEAVADVDGAMKVLDIQSPHVRAAIIAADDAVALYRSPVAQPY